MTTRVLQPAHPNDDSKTSFPSSFSFQIHSTSTKQYDAKPGQFSMDIKPDTAAPGLGSKHQSQMPLQLSALILGQVSYDSIP